MLTKVIIVAAIIGIMGFVGNFDVIEAERQQSLYCEMVAAWDESNGLNGWPPYNGREMCE